MLDLNEKNSKAEGSGSLLWNLFLIINFHLAINSKIGDTHGILTFQNSIFRAHPTNY
jgi:hypothetical protein